jgi:Ca-activated chloride channel family protein
VQLGADDAARTARRWYDLGNVQFRQGEALAEKQPQQALQRWDEALASYRQALAAAPDDADAKWNHELVTRKAELLRKQIEEQQQQQQPQDGDEPKDQQGEPQPSSDDQQGDDQRQPGEPQEQDPQQAKQEPQPTPQDGDGQDAQQHAGAPSGEQPMTPEQAAALLDAQRTQELSPSEIVRRMAPARVADPAQDW